MSGLSLSPSSELVGPSLIKIAAAESPGQGRERGEGRAEARIKSGGGTRDYRGAGCDDTSSHREIKHERERV